MRMGVPHVILAWGSYTIGVQAEGPGGRHLDGADTIAAARRLLAGVPAAAVSELDRCAAMSV